MSNQCESCEKLCGKLLWLLNYALFLCTVYFVVSYFIPAVWPWVEIIACFLLYQLWLAMSAYPDVTKAAIVLALVLFLAWCEIKNPTKPTPGTAWHRRVERMQAAKAARVRVAAPRCHPDDESW